MCQNIFRVLPVCNKAPDGHIGPYNNLGTHRGSSTLPVTLKEMQRSMDQTTAEKGPGWNHCGHVATPLWDEESSHEESPPHPEREAQNQQNHHVEGPWMRQLSSWACQGAADGSWQRGGGLGTEAWRNDWDSCRTDWSKTGKVGKEKSVQELVLERTTWLDWSKRWC